MKTNYTLLILLVVLLMGSSIQRLEAQFGYKISNSIDLILGVDIGFRVIDTKNSSPESRAEYENRSNFETYKANYRFGLNYLHGISERLSIKSGIRLSNPGFSISGVEDIDIHQSLNTIEKQKNNNLGGFIYNYGYQLFEVPLGLRYTLTKNSCEPFFELGISNNLYWRTKIIRKKVGRGGYSTTVLKESEINRLNFVGFLSTGGNINLSQDFSLFSQLIARYQLNNLRKSELSERIVSIGLEFGVRRYIY